MPFSHISKANFGAGGGGRTHTMLPSRDFESRASANSTTPAYSTLFIIINPSKKSKRFYHGFHKI